MKQPYIWDNYSDQPYPLQDKNYKKQMRKGQIGSLLKTLLVSIFVLPVSLLMTPFVKRKKINSNDFFCIGVDFEREPQATLMMIEELGVDKILLRLKLWEMEKLPLLKNFILLCQDKKVTLKIMQDREHIEDLSLLQKDLETIFSALGKYVDIFEIGSTINRAKWGFFSVDEYSRFYKVAYDLKISKFSHIKLIGSGVIDFEYHFTAHTLFNFFNYCYDGISSLLYVDRRGAPENMQMGFTLQDKIALLGTMVWLSPKSKHKLYITETNWPISGTAPYAPTSEYECVNEELYADYMLRYYLLAFASGQVDSVSWHQLIAAGYGLVDNRDGIKKRSAYATYKFMVQTLKNAEFLRFDIKRDYHILQCLVDNKLLQIHWSLKPTTIKNEDIFEVYSRDGEIIKSEKINIGSSPIYIYIKEAV
ncbi:MAG: glycosyl hydrolase [Sulfurimonas sp.]|uniref:glycosyl hydrolase n=1 Tax=Sulfurimonas sp. TaxID=2022749 RepID=UPI0026209E68|nr:glycosyl hydrolase [Sulfurimonas sp.]MDD5401292.1 glycosyl hydrolase [Sulfurimonas sp.]